MRSVGSWARKSSCRSAAARSARRAPSSRRTRRRGSSTSRSSSCRSCSWSSASRCGRDAATGERRRVSGIRILVLAVLVAGLGGYLYFYEVPQAQKEAQKEKLAGVTADDVTGVQLVYPDRTIVLAKN